MTRQTPPELYPGLPVTEGILVPVDRTLPPVPLKHTAIQASIIGPLCNVQIQQQFHNTHTQPIEAIYVFPLPEDAAVTSLSLHIGGRTIRGEVREREQAQREYEAAREAGQGAALLEQERPNIFTVSVANIQPDEEVQVMLAFHDRVPYENGAFEFVLPTVVLPRYTPDDTSEVPDMHRLTSPLLSENENENERDGHTLSVQVELDTGRLANLSSPSHQIDVDKQHTRTIVTLRESERYPNKDFILRYSVAGDQFEAAAFTYRPAGEPGTLLLMLAPQAETDPDAVMPREVLFVLDRSGSMGGDSIVQARNALRSCLRALNPGDTFNIFPFDDKVEQFMSRPVAFTQEHIDASETYINKIDARGGTDILKALQKAFDQSRDPERLRVVVFLTDGAVSNEDQVLRKLRRSLNEARVYAFGIGSAVNRFLLDKLAEVGRGSVEYIFPGQGIEEAVQRFQNRAAFPILTNISIDWGKAKVTDVYPDPLPDLYAGQPLVVMARFHSKGSAPVHLKGQTRSGRYQQTIDLEWPDATPDRSEHWQALPRVWARMRIDSLMTRERDDPKQKSSVRDTILGLALDHCLLSPYTAFVAIEEHGSEHEGRDEAVPVMVPIHLPQGTLREAFEPAPTRRMRGLAGFGSGMSLGHMLQASSPPAPGGGMRVHSSGGLQDALRPMAAFDDTDSLSFLSSPSAEEVERSGAYIPPTPESHQEADMLPEDRYDAALRYLARTQKVSGAWGDESPLATALALLAFVRGGHTDRAGDFKPQLTRAVRWLTTRAKQGTVEPAEAWALAELAAATGAPLHNEARTQATAAATAADDVGQACLALAQQTGVSTALPISRQVDEQWVLTIALHACLGYEVPARARTMLTTHQAAGGSNDGGVLLPTSQEGGQPGSLNHAATAALALVCRADTVSFYGS